MSEKQIYTVLFFAWVREVTGKDEDQIALPSDATGEHLKAYLLDAYPALTDRQGKLNLAVNQVHAEWSSTLSPKDELAVFPPVTGG